MNAQTTPTQNAPLFSVIVPIYNVQNYLSECLDSILAQDCDDFELLLINDGSTDNSLEIAQKYAAMDTRITLISQENAGLSAARNAGLAIAKGEYLVFVDSDDWLKNGALSHYKEIFQTYHCEILYTEFDCVADDGTFLDVNYCWLDSLYFNGTVHNGNSLFSLLFKTRKPLFTYAWQGAIQRSFIERYAIKFYEGIYFEDILFGMTCFSLAQSVYLSTKRFYQYRQSLISITRGGENDIKKLTKNAASYIIIAHELLALLQTPQINKIISPTTQKFYYRCVGTILKRLVRMLAKLPNNQIKYELIQNIKPLFTYMPLKLKPQFLYHIIRSKSYASLPSKEI